MRGRIRIPAERGRRSRIAAGGSDVGTCDVEGDLDEVEDLGVEGPPVRGRAGDHPFVQVVRNAEREADHEATLAS